MSKPANADIMNALHSLVAQTLTDEITKGEPSPQLLAQAIKFLKDNGIEATKAVDFSALDSLADKLAGLSEGSPDANSFLN